MKYIEKIIKFFIIKLIYFQFFIKLNYLKERKIIYLELI
jgi:hypothetical protein